MLLARKRKFSRDRSGHWVERPAHKYSIREGLFRHPAYPQLDGEVTPESYCGNVSATDKMSLNVFLRRSGSKVRSIFGMRSGMIHAISTVR